MQSPSRLQRCLNRWWPSTRLGVDPLASLRIEDRYAPVSIANWKLVPAMRERVLRARVVRPLTFDASRRLAVIIPYRDRAEHLGQLLPALTSCLQAQGIRHRIIVVEQAVPGLFNRGRLLNIGMHFTAEESDYFALHDVDAVPVNANYACPSQPLRLVHRIVQEQGETRRDPYYFSGAISVRKEQAWAANGFSNEYLGWGKEDDDFFFRLLLAECLCYYDTAGVYRDLPNPHQQQVSRKGSAVPPHLAVNRRRRSRLLRGLEDPATDGLSTLRYELIEHVTLEGCEKISVRW